MSTIFKRTIGDHFEPDNVDPKVQRQLRGHLEQIDYTANAANQKVMAGALGGLDVQKFKRLALATAEARARWVAVGIASTEAGRTPDHAQIEELARLKQAYHELTEVYDAMRRLVERGYVAYSTT